MNLNFHWMYNYGTSSIESLKEYSKVLDEHNYHSMLLVYDPKNPDYLIRTANIIDKSQKIKYMFAIRTYSISPELMAMICESFNEIDPDRVVLNICAGDKPQMDNETKIDGVVDLDILKNDVYERILYTRKWAHKFVNLKTMKKLPFLVFSGKSDYTLETAKMYGNCTLSMSSSFTDDPDRFKGIERHMVSTAIIIAEDKESLQNIMDSSTAEFAKFWTISGTKEEVKEQLLKLETLGVTDVLLTNPFRLQDNNTIHEFVKDIQSNHKISS